MSPDVEAALRQRISELEAANANLNQELFDRAKPRASELVDSLKMLTMLATAAGNPGARQLLTEFAKALDGARAAASSILVPPNGRRD
jgi:hypothetical protein